ncbi:TetR/AcrR family transcriptional regulator, partial [Amycolatopsis mediterranei]
MPEPESRPPRADAARNRDQLLAVATRVFVSAAAARTRRANAREAGVGIATLYRHFPT